MLGQSFARSVVLLSLALLSACGSDEQTPGAASTGTPPGADRNTATVTPDAGGTLTSADGRLVITFPPGAVAAPTEVWVESVPKEKAQAELAGAIPEGIAYKLGPDGQEFALPAAAELTLAIAEVPTTSDGVPAMALFTRSAAKGDEVLTATKGIGDTPLEQPAAVTHLDESGSVRVRGDLQHFSDIFGAPSEWKNSGHNPNIYYRFETTAEARQSVGDEWVATLAVMNRTDVSTKVKATSGTGCISVEIVIRGTACDTNSAKCCETFADEEVNPAGANLPSGTGLSLDPPAKYRCAKAGVDDGFSILGTVFGQTVDVAVGGNKNVICTAGAASNGDPCVVGSDCDSRSCVDLFCCNTSCEGSCQKCSLPGSEGTCSPVPAGEPDDDTCAGMSACSATGECKLGAGELCTFSTDCGSSNCVDGVCCDLACTGTCEACDVPGWVGTCNDVTAGQPDPGTCVSPNACDGVGFCVSPNGAACQTASDCLSGQCVDGVCCDSACAGTCSACDVAGSEGTCSPLPAGQTDASCSSPDSCDGSGNCQAPAANGAPCQSGAQCQSTHCVDAVCCGGACNLLCESCTAAKKNSGPDGACGATKTGEDYDSECAGPNVCASGECKAPKGAPCAVSLDCVGNMLTCRDGVCCDNSFCEPGGGDGCTACKVMWTGLPDGTCGNVIAGQDPYGNCVSPPGSLCNGMSGCQ